MDMLQFMLWPAIACLVLVGIHVYFGLHVIQRGIIFVDLSLAQIAALGTTVSFLMGYDLHGNTAYLFSLLFALIGGVIFSLTRNMNQRIPQEAIIGLVYAVSSAAAVVVVSHSPDGAEHIRHLLIGSILTVTPSEVLTTAAIYAAIGLIHWIFRKRFIPLSFGEHRGRSWWDFLFYATFAIVVTSSVKICGVLLVFVFLVAPSIFAALVANGISRRLALGWVFGIVGAVAGMVLSFALDTPSGATIVVTFGVLLAGFALVRAAVPGLRS